MAEWECEQHDLSILVFCIHPIDAACASWGRILQLLPVGPTCTLILGVKDSS